MNNATLAEIAALERIIEAHHAFLSVREVCRVESDGCRFPIYAITLGNPGPDVPAVGFFGGVHGIERIGTQVLISFLGTLLERLRWDRSLHRHLASVRMVFMPLVNPAGMWRRTRANASGIDLMRNAPIDSSAKVPFLLGGQRFSPRLPWFRGPPGTALEAESAALCRVVHEELLNSAFSICLDCHSGFGMCDRIWFPFAHSKEPIPHLAEIFVLKQLFERTYPNHNYLFEPQSRRYMTHGDLWDHLYLEALRSDKVLLPLTLEMGSWLWVKKNPLQLFTRTGLFNPLPAHRLQRVLRRHLIWFEFLGLAASSHAAWIPQGAERQDQAGRAHAHWYGGTAR